MRRVLVTGAAGFFGANAVRAFVEQGGWEVHGLDRPGVDRARLDAVAPGAKVHEVDLEDARAVRALVDEVRPELGVHLAWYVVPGKFWTAPENIDLLNASFGLCRALAEGGCKRIVTAGTCFEYDVTTGAERLGEDAPVRPTFLYSATKHAMFEVLTHATKGWGVSYAHLRFFYQYGPWEAPSRLVSDVMSALVRGEEAQVTMGEQVRDFLHIADVGRAIAAASTSELTGAVNVGSGEGIAVRDLVAAAARALNLESRVHYGARPSRPDDPPFVVADATRLRSVGWTPRLSLAAGMSDTAAWYRSRRPA
ncbi:MAG: NAD(P)-dependent oxidoreductase [Deltaproteobacteria bacterium]|nr:NAD(P)-dependent oxidoreductase [Deltaproteobacteria bacterium]